MAAPGMTTVTSPPIPSAAAGALFRSGARRDAEKGSCRTSSPAEANGGVRNRSAIALHGCPIPMKPHQPATRLPEFRFAFGTEKKQAGFAPGGDAEHLASTARLPLWAASTCGANGDRKSTRKSDPLDGGSGAPDPMDSVVRSQRPLPFVEPAAKWSRVTTGSVPLNRASGHATEYPRPHCRQ